MNDFIELNENITIVDRRDSDNGVATALLATSKNQNAILIRVGTNTYHAAYRNLPPHDLARIFDTMNVMSEYRASLRTYALMTGIVLSGKSTRVTEE